MIDLAGNEVGDEGETMEREIGVSEGLSRF